MLNDWDFAQFFTNWNATAPVVAAGTRSSEEPTEEKSSSSSGSSSGRGGVSTPPRMHRRNESDSALASVIKAQSNVADPLFSSRMPWAGNRHRSVREPTLSNDESVSLTEFSRKASQLELRSKAGGGGGGTLTSEFAPPRREKTDILDLRRLELKKELEERRRANGVENTGRHSQSEVRGSAVISSSTRPSRPPLLKSTSEPCAPLALFRDHQQVRAGQQTKKSRQSTHTASPKNKKKTSFYSSAPKKSPFLGRDYTHPANVSLSYSLSLLLC